MSSRNNFTIAHEVSHLVNEIVKMTNEEVLNVYGIQIQPDRSVFDPMYKLKFKTISEWAKFSIEQDNMEYKESYHEKYESEDY